MKTPTEITLSIFRALPDPRVERTKVHSLEVSMFIALCTYLSGGDGFYDMEDYAKARQDWLRKRIGMQSIPSHDTFNRVFQAIFPSCFGECLIEHASSANRSVGILWLLMAKHIVVQTTKAARPCIRSMPGLRRIDWYDDKAQWLGLRSFVLIESIREHGEKLERSRRYYISSLPQGEAQAAQSARAHWQIENAVHWCLDVVINEDQSRARTRNAAKNLSTLQNICLNLIRRIPGKSSLKGKRLKIALNEEFLLQALRF